MPKRKQHQVESSAQDAQQAVTEPMSSDLNQYVTTKQAAEILGVEPDHINRLLLDGKLRGIKPGGWNWLVYKPSIENYEKTRSPRDGRAPGKGVYSMADERAMCHQHCPFDFG